MAYDTWGNPLSAGGLGATTPFGFAGGYTDPSGLIYLLRRYYSPQTGQFISLDPDVSLTLRPYAYAIDNPVSLSDPTGCAVCDKTYDGPYAKVHYWRTSAGVVGWDVRLATWVQDTLAATGFSKVYVDIVNASVNGLPINPPYSEHYRFLNYDFHSSIYKYTYLRMGNHPSIGTAIIKTGDVLYLGWHFYDDNSSYTDVGNFHITCSVPKPGSGTPGPYGPF